MLREVVGNRHGKRGVQAPARSGKGVVKARWISSLIFVWSLLGLFWLTNRNAALRSSSLGFRAFEISFSRHVFLDSSIWILKSFPPIGLTGQAARHR